MEKIKTRILIFVNFIAIFLFMACSKDKALIFATSPSERINEEINKLKIELSSAKEGWKLTYYKHINRNLFSNINENLKKHSNSISYIKSKYGDGGFTFWIKFYNNNSVEMISDHNDITIKTNIRSVYEIKHGAGIQLSFLTYNYIHKMVVTDFVFIKKIAEGKLLFKSMSFLESDREYILMEKVDSVDKKNDEINSLLINKLQLESKLRDPILIIKDSLGKVLFKSNYSEYGSSINKELRYALFLKNNKPDALVSDYFTGLGSGYSFTDGGIMFIPGFRLNSKIVFNFFMAQTDTSFISFNKKFSAQITEKNK